MSNQRREKVLAADVGGTHVRLALCSTNNGSIEIIYREDFETADFASFEDIIRPFCDKNDLSGMSACIGIPGPVIMGQAATPNLTWKFDQNEIAQLTGLRSVILVYDLFALANGVTQLSPEEYLNIYPGEGKDTSGITTILAPGTGLGQAFQDLSTDPPTIFPSEGGHIDFAPTDELETGLLIYLQKKFRRVSYERVISGPGLFNIYSYLKDMSLSLGDSSFEQRLTEEDPAAVIAEAGLNNHDPLCTQTLNIFASILGSLAGNLVLTYVATGGIFIAGGVAMKLQEKLTDGTMVKHYLKKGRMSPLVRRTPIRLITSDITPLKGAATIAFRSVP